MPGVYSPEPFLLSSCHLYVYMVFYSKSLMIGHSQGQNILETSCHLLVYSMLLPRISNACCWPKYISLTYTFGSGLCIINPGENYAVLMYSEYIPL